VPRELVEVAPGVLVATSRTMTTTSTAVVRDGDALLVDPAWHPDELVGLADALDARGLHVVAGIATHAHHDHLLWHPRFGGVPRWASPRTVALAREHRAELREALVDGAGAHGWSPELLDLVGAVRSWAAPTRAGIRSAGSERAATAELTPTAGLPGEPELVVHDAHAPGHAAVWLDAPRVLLAGDMLSDVELPLPLDPDDLPAYLDGLDRLAPYVARARVVVPGHDADDPRRENPGMAVVHARVRALAAAQR
jgi:glyoxylase-like metal-dependent hydrolase (beta-lactamase superfamily II)